MIRVFTSKSVRVHGHCLCPGLFESPLLGLCVPPSSPPCPRPLSSLPSPSTTPSAGLLPGPSASWLHPNISSPSPPDALSPPNLGLSLPFQLLPATVLQEWAQLEASCPLGGLQYSLSARQQPRCLGCQSRGWYSRMLQRDMSYSHLRSHQGPSHLPNHPTFPSGTSKHHAQRGMPC